MRRSPLLPIFLIVVVDVLGLTIILPLLPFFAEKLGASPSQVGALVATYAVCQLVAGPLLGRLSDTTGRKPLLLVSQLGTLIGFIGFAAIAVTGLLIGGALRMGTLYPATTIGYPYGHYEDFRPVGVRLGKPRDFECIPSQYWFPNGRPR